MSYLYVFKYNIEKKLAKNRIKLIIFEVHIV